MEAVLVFLDIPHKYQPHLSFDFPNTMSCYPGKVYKFLFWTHSCCPPFAYDLFKLSSHLMAVPDPCSPHWAWVEEVGQQSEMGEVVREKEWTGQEVRNSKKWTFSKQKVILHILFSGYLTSCPGPWFAEMLSIAAATELNRTWTLL